MQRQQKLYKSAMNKEELASTREKLKAESVTLHFNLGIRYATQRRLPGQQKEGPSTGRPLQTAVDMVNSWNHLECLKLG